MSPLDELEKRLESLTRAEKAQLLQWVVRALGDWFPGIVSLPERLRRGTVPGADADSRLGLGAIPASRHLRGRSAAELPDLAGRDSPRPGRMSARTARRSSGRSARTKRRRRWPGSTATKTFQGRLRPFSAAGGNRPDVHVGFPSPPNPRPLAARRLRRRAARRINRSSCFDHPS